MSAFRKQEFINRVIQARVEFDDEIGRIADDFRRDVLIPLCRRHKLEYRSGNGTFAFFTEDDRVAGTVWAARNERMSYVIPVLVVLNEEIDHANHFGFYVYDVTASDY